jgi:CRP-like cAMP-binding protein
MPPTKPDNRLLARLSEGEFKRLSAHLQAVPLPVKKVLYKAYAPLDYVYFPTSGVVSSMTVMEDGNAIEVATIGNEGMVGLTAFVGGETSPNEVMVQVEGKGLRMKAKVFSEEAGKGPLKKLLALYHTVFQLRCPIQSPVTVCTKSNNAAVAGFS